MASRGSPRRSETARLREAAETAIDQLDWVISYFHRIRKHQLATSLKRNRDTIVKRMRRA
jgi:hypothetical protein